MGINPPSPIKTISLLSIFSLTCLALCSCKAKKAADTPKPPVSFERARFFEITPLLDGSAYAKSLDFHLWYLRGNKAVLVSAVANAAHKLPEFLEIIPILDGGAYATTLEAESGLWYLHAERAEKVSEATSLADSTTPVKPSDKAFYALYLSERKKRKDAEYRTDDLAEFSDPPEDPRF